MTDVFVVMECYVDLTDPEPNVYVSAIFSTQEQAEARVNAINAEESGVWCKWYKRTIDAKDSSIDVREDVDMERFF